MRVPVAMEVDTWGLSLSGVPRKNERYMLMVNERDATAAEKATSVCPRQSPEMKSIFGDRARGQSLRGILIALRREEHNPTTFLSPVCACTLDCLSPILLRTFSFSATNVAGTWHRFHAIYPSQSASISRKSFGAELMVVPL